MKSIVIGAGYGDEGKGKVVDWLASQDPNALVVRYSGGSQCGHTVIHPDKGNPSQANSENDNIIEEKYISHRFRIIGSGSLNGNSTFIGEEVVFDPIILWKELIDIGLKSETTKFQNLKVFIHKNCPIVTPYDIWVNQHSSSNIEHGTCGNGIFTTKLREKNNYHLLFKDFYYPEILKWKLKAIESYYNFPLKNEDGLDMTPDFDDFYKCVEKIINSNHFIPVSKLPEFENYIFESSQGLLLDERIGFFPHCTPSKLDIPEQYLSKDEPIDKYIVSRLYHTRHGNGPFTTINIPTNNTYNNKYETNETNKFQGTFKSEVLDVDLLNYAINSSNIFDFPGKVNMIFNHCDIVDKQAKGYSSDCYHVQQYVLRDMIDSILQHLPKFDEVYVGDGPSKDDLHNIKSFCFGSQYNPNRLRIKDFQKGIEDYIIQENSQTVPSDPDIPVGPGLLREAGITRR